MVVVMRPFGEIVVPPSEVTHSACELSKLTYLLKSLPGEQRLLWNVQVLIVFLSPTPCIMQEFLFPLYTPR